MEIAMRMERIKLNELSYYHCMNRICGTKDSYPFHDEAKQKFIDILESYSKLYNIHTLSYTVMGNHYHTLICTLQETLSKEVLSDRWEKFYVINKDKKWSKFYQARRPDWNDRDEVTRWNNRLNDLSDFIKVIQQKFTRWYNKTYNRRGHLWGDRFKSVLIQSGKHLWDCTKYVEFNPFRAYLAGKDYDFSSFGKFYKSGIHPCYKNLIQHFKHIFRLPEKTCDKECFQTIEEVYKTALTQELKILETKQNRRDKKWSKAVAIGDKSFLREKLKGLSQYKRLFC